jgi:hypothetical protein
VALEIIEKLSPGSQFQLPASSPIAVLNNEFKKMVAAETFFIPICRKKARQIIIKPYFNFLLLFNILRLLL